MTPRSSACVRCCEVSDVLRRAVFSLTPHCVLFDRCDLQFCNVWAGNYGTVARSHQTEYIYAWGLNASGQLGIFYCLLIDQCLLLLFY